MEQDTSGEAGASALYAIHEMCQPLTAILLNAKAALLWMDQDSPNLAEVKRSIEGIIGNGQRAADVAREVRDTLRTSRSTTLKIDINEIVLDSLDRASPILKRHGIDGQIDLAEKLAPVRGNGVQLSGLTANLIANAVDAMSTVEGERRKLRIRTQLGETGDVRCSVEDTGTGIDPAQIERIFDPYFTTKSEGLGLGLSICKSIVTAHGGRLWATHNRPHGSIFGFSLPSVA